MAKDLSRNLDLLGAIVALILGILLVVGALDLELVVGIALIVIGALALSRNL